MEALKPAEHNLLLHRFGSVPGGTGTPEGALAPAGKFVGPFHPPLEIPLIGIAIGIQKCIASD